MPPRKRLSTMYYFRIKCRFELLGFVYALLSTIIGVWQGVYLKMLMRTGLRKNFVGSILLSWITNRSIYVMLLLAQWFFSQLFFLWRYITRHTRISIWNGLLSAHLSNIWALYHHTLYVDCNQTRKLMPRLCTCFHPFLILLLARLNVWVSSLPQPSFSIRHYRSVI